MPNKHTQQHSLYLMLRHTASCRDKQHAVLPKDRSIQSILQQWSQTLMKASLFRLVHLRSPPAPQEFPADFPHDFTSAQCVSVQSAALIISAGVQFLVLVVLESCVQILFVSAQTFVCTSYLLCSADKERSCKYANGRRLQAVLLLICRSEHRSRHC